MDKNQIVGGLIKKAEKDIQTAKDLFRLKHYDWSLFIWHLALEKILKVKLIIQDIKIDYTHNLARIARKTHIILSNIQLKQLNEITTFNIEARYDDYKLSFYNKATEEYTQKWSKICESLYLFFKKDL